MMTNSVITVVNQLFDYFISHNVTFTNLFCLSPSWSDCFTITLLSQTSWIYIYHTEEAATPTPIVLANRGRVDIKQRCQSVFSQGDFITSSDLLSCSLLVEGSREKEGATWLEAIWTRWSNRWRGVWELEIVWTTRIITHRNTDNI